VVLGLEFWELFEYFYGGSGDGSWRGKNIKTKYLKKKKLKLNFNQRKINTHDGIRVRFRSRSASFPPYVRSFSSPEFLCKMDNEIRGRQNVLFLPPVHKSLGSQ